MQESLTGDAQDMAYELSLLQEWEHIQRELLASAITASHTKSLSWRRVIDTRIARCTKGRAFLYWEPLALGNAVGCDRFCEVRFQQTRYGFLGLTPGYLASRCFPDIPQDFARLCAMVLALVEYQALVHYQLDSLPPLFPGEAIDRLTRRERDVLLGLIRGKSDAEMAMSLGIEPTTVHTHRKRLYRRLGAHSAQEATLRCFTHRLVDWLDGPDDGEPAHIPFDREVQAYPEEAMPADRGSDYNARNGVFPMRDDIKIGIVRR